MSKRYEAVYLHPNFCDGFYDNEKKRYLKSEEVDELLEYKLKSDEIEEILNREVTDNMDENENIRNSFKNVIEGIALVILGFSAIIWYFVKLISIIMIAGLISTRLGLVSYYWWFSSIIIFCIFLEILFQKSSTDSFQELCEKYKKRVNERNK